MSRPFILSSLVRSDNLAHAASVDADKDSEVILLQESWLLVNTYDDGINPDGCDDFRSDRF